MATFDIFKGAPDHARHVADRLGKSRPHGVNVRVTPSVDCQLVTMYGAGFTEADAVHFRTLARGIIAEGFQPTFAIADATSRQPVARDEQVGALMASTSLGLETARRIVSRRSTAQAEATFVNKEATNPSTIVYYFDPACRTRRVFGVVFNHKHNEVSKLVGQASLVELCEALDIVFAMIAEGK